MVHRLSDLRNLGKTLHRPVEPLLHHANHARELSEFLGFRRSQWISLEERDNADRQIFGIPDVVSPEMLPVIVVAAVDVHASASEELPQFVQNMHAPLPLNHDECRLDLPTHAPISPVAEDRNTEAAFPVNEADDPLLVSWPFLLIARTCRFVTGHAFHYKKRG